MSSQVKEKEAHTIVTIHTYQPAFLGIHMYSSPHPLRSDPEIHLPMSHVLNSSHKYNTSIASHLCQGSRPSVSSGQQCPWTWQSPGFPRPSYSSQGQGVWQSSVWSECWTCRPAWRRSRLAWWCLLGRSRAWRKRPVNYVSLVLCTRRKTTAVSGV